MQHLVRYASHVERTGGSTGGSQGAQGGSGGMMIPPPSQVHGRVGDAPGELVPGALRDDRR